VRRFATAILWSEFR